MAKRNPPAPKPATPASPADTSEAPAPATPAAEAPASEAPAPAAPAPPAEASAYRIRMLTGMEGVGVSRVRGQELTVGDETDADEAQRLMDANFAEEA